MRNMIAPLYYNLEMNLKPIIFGMDYIILTWQN